MNQLAYIENIAILAAVCFLVWATDSGWWALLMLWVNYPKKADK